MKEFKKELKESVDLCDTKFVVSKKMVLRLRSGYNEKDVWMKYAVHECVVKRFTPSSASASK